MSSKRSCSYGTITLSDSFNQDPKRSCRLGSYLNFVWVVQPIIDTRLPEVRRPSLEIAIANSFDWHVDSLDWSSDWPTDWYGWPIDSLNWVTDWQSDSPIDLSDWRFATSLDTIPASCATATSFAVEAKLRASSRTSRKAATFDLSDDSVASFVATCFTIPFASRPTLRSYASLEPIQLVPPSSVLSLEELGFKELILQEAAPFFLIKSIAS